MINVATRVRIAALSLWVATSCLAGVDVSTFATGGAGTSASPWTGWDTAVTWSAESQYDFRSGVYAYSVSPNFMKPGIALKGEAGTVLKFTGSGNAVVFDNPGTAPQIYDRWTQNIRFENFIIQGTASATNGLYVRGARNAIFKHISVRDIAGAGFWCEACVTNILENFRVTHHEMPLDVFAVVPAYGIVLGARNAGEDTTTTSIINPVIEGVSVIGIWIKANSANNIVSNGTSEGNTGKGMQMDGMMNTVIATDFEANVGSNLEVTGMLNTFIGIVSNGIIEFKSGYLNRIQGRISNLTIRNQCTYTDISGSMITVSLTDEGDGTIKGHYFMPDGFKKQPLVASMFALPPSGTITTDLTKGSFFSVLITGSATLGNVTTSGPALLSDGRSVTWRCQQDATGGRVLSYGTAFESMSGGALPALNPAPNAYTEITAHWNAARGKWQFP